MREEQETLWHEEPEDDGKLPADQTKICGACRNEFWSRVRRDRPTFVPMHCNACYEKHGAELTERARRLRRTHYYDSRGDTWRPHGYVKPPRKNAKHAKEPATAPGPRAAQTIDLTGVADAILGKNVQPNRGKNS